VYNLS